MTPMVRWLIWVAVLVGGWSMILDWQDELAVLRPERARMETLRQREEAAMKGFPWVEQAGKAHAAQLAWLERLPVVGQIGVFRAEAMESMADLCKRLEAACQIAAMGESATAVASASSSKEGRKGAVGPGVAGLLSTSIRVTIGLPGNKLMPLLQQIENGSQIRRVEKFTVRSGRADFIVKTYGLEATAAEAVTKNVFSGTEKLLLTGAGDSGRRP